MRAFRFIPDLIEEPPLNLTSLIDVVFVILITFIVIAPLLEVDQISLAPGRESTESVSAPQHSPITLCVRQDNSILLNGRPSSLLELTNQLEALHRNHPTAIPQLFQDQKAYFGTYQAIKHVVEESGFSELDVILEPKG